MAKSHKPGRILLIDDDAMSREVLRVLLEAEGYVVTSQDSGDAALSLLALGEPPPQLVLTDLQMPGTAGRPLAEKLRHACGPATMLLAMSGSEPTKRTLSRYDGFLRKPFDVAEVSAALRAYVADVPRAESAHPSRAKGRILPMESLPGDDPSALAARPGHLTSLAASAPATDTHLSLHPSPQDGSSGNTPAGAAAPLNERIYTQLVHAMPLAQLHQIYAVCIRDARERIASMRRFASAGDDAQFHRQAHTLKGGCGMLGATEMYLIAAELESTGLKAAGFHSGTACNPLDVLSAACERLESILGARAPQSL